MFGPKETAMQQVLRPFVTTSVALVGASLIAVTPVTAPPPDIQMRDVALTAGALDLSGIDPITEWQDVFNTTVANAQTVFQALSEGNTELFQAIAADPSALFNPTTAQELFDAATFLGGDQKTFLNPLAAHTMDDNGLHLVFYEALTGQFPTSIFPTPAEPIPEIVNFLSSPLSGVLIGELGPMVSPWVALLNSIEAVVTALSGPTPDLTTALDDLINTPANVVNGFFNGATLDLNALIPLIEQLNLVPLPDGSTINDLSFAFGGLFSPGEVGTGVSGVPEGVGGSIFNSVGINVTLVTSVGTIGVAPEGTGVGPIGAVAGLEDILAGVLTGSIFDPAAPADVGGTLGADLLSGL
jgi:hypothetical protein